MGALEDEAKRVRFSLRRVRHVARQPTAKNGLFALRAMRRRRDAQEGLARAHAHVLEAPALDDLEAELARELQEELLARLQVVVAARVRPADDLQW